MGETVTIIALVVLAWLLYLLPAVPLSLSLCYFGRKRVQFMWWELGAFILPFIVWLIVSVFSKDKGLWSLLVEVLILGCTVPVAALVRVIVGSAVNRSLMAGSLMFLICVVAVLLGIMYPKIEFQPFVK
jgi:hypothetical protein